MTGFINAIITGDCLVESAKIPSGSVDLILTDLPYGTVKNIGDSESIKHGMKGKTAWDDAIDPKEIYVIANRILRKNGKMVLFSQEPYSSRLVTEAMPDIPFSYRMIWEKDHFANALVAKKAPVSYYEDILVFSKSGSGENNETKDYLIKEKTKAYESGWKDKTLRELCGVSLKGGGLLGHYWGTGQWMMPTERIYTKLQHTGFFQKPYSELQDINLKYANTFNLWQGNKYKSNVLKYKKDYNGYHPTQKPVLLLEDLIKTFSNEGDTVVDLTAGSGSTAVAAINTGRNFIAIEQDVKYADIARQRITTAGEGISVCYECEKPIDGAYHFSAILNKKLCGKCGDEKYDVYDLVEDYNAEVNG